MRKIHSEWSINNLISAAWRLCIIIVLVIDLFLSWMKYACKKDMLNNFTLLLWGLCGVHFLYLFFLKKNKKSPFYKIVLMGLISFAFQLWLVRNYYFRTGWDVETMIFAAEAAARGAEIPKSYYFSMYPNNLFLTSFFARIISFGCRLGLSELHAYDLLLVLQCGISCIVGIETCFVVHRISKNSNLAYITFIFYFALITLSPWVSIPYSDSYGIFFPITILFLYILPQKRRFRELSRWVLIGFLALIGYRIKPTVFIVFIALCIIELFNWLKNKARSTSCIKIAGIITGMVLAYLTVALTTRYMDIEIDKEAAFGPTHFLNMGLNEETMGVYYYPDVEFSASFESYKDRANADLSHAMQRIKEMGFKGTFRQLLRKTLTNFNDGTFAWAWEGDFFPVVYECRDKVISPYIRSFYYPDKENYFFFVNSEQSVWLAILSLSVFAMGAEKKKYSGTIMLTLIGTMIYGLLFEARARYFYIYAPFFIVLACLGLQTIQQRVSGNKVLHIDRDKCRNEP